MNLYISINEIESRVNEIYQTLNVSRSINSLITFDVLQQDATPFVSVDKEGYHYLIIERGRILRHCVTYKIDELLCWIFTDVTFSLALDDIFNHPKEGIWEQRRILFQKQLALLRKINPEYAKPRYCHILEILSRVPFTDGRPNTPDYDGD